MTSTEVQRKGCSSFITCQHFLLKLLYLLQDTGHECGYEIYQVIFLKHIGLSSKQAGLILSVQQLAAVAVSPFLGMISDKTKRTKELLIVLLVSGSFILFAQFFVRPLSSKNDVKLFGDLDLSCYNCTEKTISESLFASLELQNISSFEFVQVNCFNSTLDVALITNQNLTQHVATKPSPCNRVKENMLRKCIANWVNVSEENLRLKSSSTAHLLLATSGNIRCVGRRNFANVTIGDDQRETTDDSTFWIMLILVLLSVFSVRGCEPIIDATVISALGEENEWKFGRIILPGTISAGIMSAVVGKLKDLTEEYIGAYAATTTNISYIPMYASTALAWFCAAYVTYKSDITSEISTPVKLADIKTVFKNVHFIIFVLLLILYGFAQGVLGGYVFWFAEVKLNAPTVVLGLSTLAGCISDIPALFFSGHVIRRIGSPAIFIISMILFAVRFYLYCLLTQAWMIIPIDMFRSVTFGLMWPAICTYAGSISPPELQATTMAIVHAASWNFGLASGVISGGYLFDEYGADGLFKFASLACLVGAFAYSIVHFFVSKFFPQVSPRLGERKESGVEDVELDSMIEKRWS